MEKRDRPELGSSLVATLTGVRSDDERFPVELWRDGETGRLKLRAYNEAGFSYTEIDVWDLLACLRRGPIAGETFFDSPTGAGRRRTR